MFNKKKGLVIIVVIVVVIVVFAWFIYRHKVIYQYSAKYMCGTVDGPATTAPLAPGEYRTDVNIHNPAFESITLWKKVVSSLPREPETGKPSKRVELTLGPDEAFEVDCADIASLHGQGIPKFDKGFVVLQSRDKLDVIDVLTVKEEHRAVIKDPEIPPNGPDPGPRPDPIPVPGSSPDELLYQFATFIVRGEPIDGLPYRLDTKLTAPLGWGGESIFDNETRIREDVLKPALVDRFGAERAEAILKGQRVEYEKNDTVLISGSVSLDFELIPARRLRAPYP